MDFLQDSEQCDPGVVDDSKLDQLEAFPPRRFYFLWENRHWSVGALNFDQDRLDWAAMQEAQRETFMGTIAPFFAGEERIAISFAPIILSADDEQEAAFFATQQADEARHMQLFDRFWREIAAPDLENRRPPSSSARARCNEAFGELFDRRLAQALDRLRLNPRDADAKVEAITIYYLIVEGIMGLTGLHFLIGYLKRNSILQAVATGLRNVERDEHQHVGYGTWFLRRKCREDARYGRIVQSTLMELLPVVASVLIEGGIDACCEGLEPVEVLDYPSAAVTSFALLALSRRLKVIGGATGEIQRFAASWAWRAARTL
jgi:ribonucleoside-diphosphate reductase beta chain